LDRTRTLETILDQQVIAIVREDSTDAAVRRAEVLIAAGLRAVEVSLTTPQGFAAVGRVARSAPREVAVGAGTVLDEAMAAAACEAGADFLVSPITHEHMIAAGQRSGAVVIPGATTPTEIAHALERGADLVKLFPAGVLGVDYLRALIAPMPDAPIVPTGGIRPEDVAAWLEAGAVAVALGSALTRGRDAEVRDRVRELIRTTGREVAS
jgi:2-dehydro-3-deoxyphosphogluconate aldolase / (4S)-4-hydroxy-2-oxoglutarate aldolase